MSKKPLTAAEKVKQLLASAGKPIDNTPEKLNKPKKPVRGKNGGARPGAGRKPIEQTLIRRGIKQYIDDHTNEEVEVQIVDPKTGQTRTVKEPRVVRVMKQLYLIGIGATDKGNAPALKEWLDRAVGKSPQPIKGDEHDETPIRMEHDISKILEKAYGED